MKIKACLSWLPKPVKVFFMKVVFYTVLPLALIIHVIDALKEEIPIFWQDSRYVLNEFLNKL